MSAKNPVAGVVLRDGQDRYLLVQEKQKQAYGLWNLPAGWIDEGETPQQAAIREAKEEVGFDVKLIDDKPLHTALNSSKDRSLTSFKAEIIGGELKFQEDELLDAKWLSLEEIKRLKADGKLRADWVLESIYKVEEL
jgi:8-oxo-dGTP diphosphatase